ncbi:DNA repair protein RecO [Sungkyunkwania multivorans]|uniref:DNA repair protein RecO n=1 Tax=Sungkyunkwania multivorans TaxID=1173618 RepID=A0ABW3D088_9FLAO
MITTKAIVINTIKYGDSSLIAKCYTQEYGMRSYLLRGILGSRKGKLKVAYFQPLTILELTASNREKGTLEYIKEVKVHRPYISIFQDMRKRGIAMFISEVLSNSIQQEESDSLLYDYLENTLIWLDMHNEVANFHLLFLLNLSKFLGFYPDVQRKELPYFDLLEGKYSKIQPQQYFVEGDELELLNKLLGIKFDVLHSIKFSARQRNELLHILIGYFQLHLQGFKRPRSLDVLKELFR